MLAPAVGRRRLQAGAYRTAAFRGGAYRRLPTGRRLPQGSLSVQISLLGVIPVGSGLKTHREPQSTPKGRVVGPFWSGKCGRRRGYGVPARFPANAGLPPGRFSVE